MRQYGEVPPTLSPAVAPLVASTSGLGTGGGASVQTPDGQGFGAVHLVAGPGAGPGQVVLSFPQVPPTLFFAAPENFGTLTVTGQGSSSVTVAWSASLGPGRHRIAYEWSVSQ